MSRKEKIVRKIMSCCGHKRSVAEILYCIIGMEGEIRLVDIERGMRLSQPIVSTGMKTLIEEGIVGLDKLVRENYKGRPIKIFKKLLSNEQILDKIKRKTLDRLEEEVEKIQQLIKITGSLQKVSNIA